MESRILRGADAKKHWPGVVSIQDRSTSIYGGHAAHVCGGTLVSSRWVLTAAHCLEGDLGGSRPLDVLLGTRDLRHRNSERRTVTYRKIEPNYTEDGSNFDIALLYLNRPSKQPPARLSRVAPVPGEKLWVAGWGAGKHRFPSLLKQASLKVSKGCGRSWLESEFIVCANSPRKRRSVCAGDSGSPLFRSDGTLAAVTNFSGLDSYRCWNWFYPSGFARVDSHLKWIERVMSNPPPEHKSNRPRHPARPYGTKKLPVSFSVRGRYQTGPDPVYDKLYFAEISSTYPIKWARLLEPRGITICSESPENFPGTGGCWNSRFPAPMPVADGADRAGIWFRAASNCLRGLTIRLRVGRKIYNEPWDLCAR